MSKKHQSRMPFQLESLETRTLLAGDMDAISSTGSFLTNFEQGTLPSRVTIASVEGGRLTIDSALLPDTVKELTISGFTSVTITGIDGFQKLDLSQIGSFSGEQINVTGELRTKNVASLTLHSIAGMARLHGNETRLDVVDARSATILSDVDKLIVSSSNHMGQLWAGDIEHQELRFEFSLDQFKDEAELLEFLALFKDRSDIFFLDSRTIYPQKSSPTPTDPSKPDVIERPDGSSYIVIVISISSANGANPFVARLQDALAKGDAEGVRNALSAYFNSTSLTDSSQDMNYPGADLARTAFKELNSSATLEFAASFDSETWTETATSTPSLVTLGINLSIAAPAPRLTNVLGENFAVQLSPAEAAPSSVETLDAHRDVRRDVSENAAHATDHEREHILDGIRSTLSSLVPGMDSQVTTVSSYIINRLGHELEPGVLPGLLVDPKSIRSRRDFGWIQL